MSKKSKNTNHKRDDAPHAAAQSAEELPVEVPSTEEVASSDAIPSDAPTDAPTDIPTDIPKAAAEIPAAENEDFKEQYLRLRADFENFRKRTRREKEEWTQRCLDNLCSDLLTVLDHFDLGIDNSQGKEFTPDTLKGFELVRGQLIHTLGKYGLSVVDTPEGVFDPNLQEAITHMPSTEVEEGGIVAVTRKGYKLGNKLLRPVQVVVSAGAPEAAATEAEGDA